MDKDMNMDMDKNKETDKEVIFFTLFLGWYLYNFGPTYNLLILMNFIYVKK